MGGLTEKSFLILNESSETVKFGKDASPKEWQERLTLKFLFYFKC